MMTILIAVKKGLFWKQKYVCREWKNVICSTWYTSVPHVREATSRSCCPWTWPPIVNDVQVITFTLLQRSRQPIRHNCLILIPLCISCYGQNCHCYTESFLLNIKYHQRNFVCSHPCMGSLQTHTFSKLTIQLSLWKTCVRRKCYQTSVRWIRFIVYNSFIVSRVSSSVHTYKILYKWVNYFVNYRRAVERAPGAASQETLRKR